MDKSTLLERSTATYQAPPPKQLTYCLYARKSSESDERQALSIDSQIKEMLELAQRDKIDVVDVRRESHSAKDSAARPVFNQLLADVRSGRFNSILTWAPDRLSRNAGDLGGLVDLMDQKLLYEIKTPSQKFTNNPSEKFLLMILCSQAKLENDNKSLNVKRGLKTKVEMGLWTGVAPTGYLNEKRTDRKGYVIVDPKRGPIIKQAFEKAAYEKWSGRKVYQWLKFDIKFTTKNGAPLYLSNVYKILDNSFYTGTFEYPRGSGKWYTGKHTPLITKETFELARQQIAEGAHHNYRGSKEFAFTKLLTCGLCGSGITADEKFKKLKDGSEARYVYYGCTRAHDLHCSGGYIREEDLVKQFAELIDKLSVDELGIRHKLEQEVERYHKFQANVLKTNTKDTSIKDVDIKKYAKYLLCEGTIIEKRDLLACMKSKLMISNKKILFSK